MPPMKRIPSAGATVRPARAIEDELQSVLRWLARRGTRRNREGMARYGIRTPKAYGVSMTTMRPLARRLGRDHALAAALWDSGWHEARILASFVDEPARVTAGQMDRWAHDFDNWAVCDTICFQLFDRTPHAWAKVADWRDAGAEFVKRAAFALLAGLAGHDKNTGDEPFVQALRWIERAADDERHLVKKAVNWALRRIGGRSPALHSAAVAVAQRLGDSPRAATRWIGKDALRKLTRPTPLPRSTPSRGQRR